MSDACTLLALDPSSTRTGYALFSGERLTAFGYLTPFRTRDPPLKRIATMADDVRKLIIDYKPHHVAIEVTSGKVGQRHRGEGAGLAVYGMAVGAIYFVARLQAEGHISGVTETEWTRGISKSKRQQAIAIHFPAYRARQAADNGRDLADAIGVGLWWMRERRTARAMSGVL